MVEDGVRVSVWFRVTSGGIVQWILYGDSVLEDIVPLNLKFSRWLPYAVVQMMSWRLCKGALGEELLRLPWG